MGAWGTGLWSDDTACDVRATYREALEDGLSNEEAADKVLAEFAPDLADVKTARPWSGSRLRSASTSGAVDQRGLRACPRCHRQRSRLAALQGASPRLRATRAAVLAKIRDKLTGPQPERRLVRRPARRLSTLLPGDVLAYQAHPAGFTCWWSGPWPRTGTACFRSSAYSTSTRRGFRKKMR